MCCLWNIAMQDYQESVTTGQSETHTRTDRQTDARQSDPYVPLCFAGDTKTMGVSSDMSKNSKLYTVFLPETNKISKVLLQLQYTAMITIKSLWYHTIHTHSFLCQILVDHPLSDEHQTLKETKVFMKHWCPWEQQCWSNFDLWPLNPKIKKVLLISQKLLLWIAEFSWGTNFRGLHGGSNPRILVPTNKWFSVWIMKENTMPTNFEPHKGVIFFQSMKIGTHENRAIHRQTNRPRQSESSTSLY